MKLLTREWVDKAEGDFITAQRERRARKAPNYDAACFHVQQCIEKYLKAILQEHDVVFEKTHNLIVLLDQVLDIAPMLEAFRTDLLVVIEYAVAFRYPGESAEKADAEQSFKIGLKFRAEALKLLSLRH